MKKSCFLLLASCFLLFITGCEKKKEAPSRPAGFILKDLQGNEYALNKLRGKVVIIDFWATWCRPCLASIPIFNAVYDKYKDKGFLILGIGLDKEEALRRFVQVHQINYPVLVGNQEVAKNYGIYAIPTTFIIDKEGKVASKHVGLIPEMQTTLEEEIKNLIE